MLLAPQDDIEKKDTNNNQSSDNNNIKTKQIENTNITEEISGQQNNSKIIEKHNDTEITGENQNKKPHVNNTHTLTENNTQEIQAPQNNSKPQIQEIPEIQAQPYNKTHPNNVQENETTTQQNKNSIEIILQEKINNICTELASKEYEIKNLHAEIKQIRSGLAIKEQYIKNLQEEKQTLFHSKNAEIEEMKGQIGAELKLATSEVGEEGAGVWRGGRGVWKGGQGDGVGVGRRGGSIISLELVFRGNLYLIIFYTIR